MKQESNSTGSAPAAWWIGVGLVAAVLVVYARALTCSWVAFDDFHHVLKNPVVQHGLSFDAVTKAFTTAPASLWIPVTWISFMSELSVFGAKPWGYHLTNILLHAANTWLVWRFLLAVTGRGWPSLFAAALFGLHPLNVESVAWITELKNTLSTFFWLLSLRAWLAYGRQGGWPSYLSALGFFILGGMSKPMIVTLPATLLLLDWWPLERWQRTTWVRLLAEKIPFAVGSLGFAAATIWAHTATHSLATAETLPMSGRLLNVLSSYGIYLGQMVWPVNLAILYRHPMDVDVATAIAGGALILVISAIAWTLRGRYPELIWGWLWYLVTLLPVVGFFATGSEASADRFAYVPLIGPFAAIACLGARLGRRMVAPAIAILVIFSVLSFQQIPVWQNSLTLFRRAYEVNPNGFRAVSNMAYMLTYIREFPAAELLYRRALELNPRSAGTWDSLGGVLQQMGRTPEAIDCARKALAIDPKQIVTRCNLASALEATGDLAGAEIEWRRATVDDPKLAAARFRLGKLLLKGGKRDEAYKELTAAAELDPTNKEFQAALEELQASPAR